MSPDTGTITKPTERSIGTTAADECIYDVAGFLFRFDPALPRARASAWRDGRWQLIALTGEDICELASPRPVRSEELAQRLAEPREPRY